MAVEQVDLALTSLQNQTGNSTKSRKNHPELPNENLLNNLSDAEFKTLVIRMLRELLEYGKKIKEEMKVILGEIKNNPQETNREGKEARIQTNDLEHKKEINGPGWCDSVD